MRMTIKIWAVLLLAAACWFGTMDGRAAAADYPYQDMPCIHAPYAIQGSAAAWCSNYDWGLRRNDTGAASTISPLGYAYRNCTDYVAWRLAGDGIASSQYRGLGHAKTWADRAQSRGLSVDGRPAAGAVAVRPTGAYGHVAYVLAVYEDDTIRVAQYNKHGEGSFSEATGTPAGLGFSRFIHFESIAPAPVASMPATPAIASPPADVAEAPLPAPAEEGGEAPGAIAANDKPVTATEGSVESNRAAEAFVVPETVDADDAALPPVHMLAAVASDVVHDLPRPAVDTPDMPDTDRPVGQIAAIAAEQASLPQLVAPPAVTSLPTPAAGEKAAILATSSEALIVPYTWQHDTIPSPAAMLPAIATGHYALYPGTQRVVLLAAGMILGWMVTWLGVHICVRFWWPGLQKAV
jgi:hypothetical protein